MIPRYLAWLERWPTPAVLAASYAAIKAADVQALDVRWTPQMPIVAGQDNGNSA